MKVRYDVADHELLSDAAKAVGEERLFELNALAEEVLGLADLALSGTSAERATRYVARQVNYLVEMGEEGFALQSSSRGARSRSFRSTDGRAIPLDPIARKGAAELRHAAGQSGTGWGSVTSVRG